MAQILKLGHQACIGAVRRRCSHMDFVEDGFFPWSPYPGGIGPLIYSGVDNEAQAMDVVGLKSGGGIGHYQAAVDPVALAATCAGLLRNEAIPAFVASRHGKLGIIEH